MDLCYLSDDGIPLLLDHYIFVTVLPVVKWTRIIVVLKVLPHKKFPLDVSLLDFRLNHVGDRIKYVPSDYVEERRFLFFFYRLLRSK